MGDQRSESKERPANGSRSGGEHAERRTWWTIVAVGAVILFATMWLGRPLVEGRLVAARNLDGAIAGMKSADSELASIDRQVRSTVATAAGTGGAAGVQTAQVRSRLQQLALQSRDGYDRLTEDEQRRARLVEQALIARLEVVAAADAILSGSGASAPGVDAGQALAEYERAKTKVDEADTALANL